MTNKEQNFVVLLAVIVSGHFLSCAPKEINTSLTQTDMKMDSSYSGFIWWMTDWFEDYGYAENYVQKITSKDSGEFIIFNYYYAQHYTFFSFVSAINDTVCSMDARMLVTAQNGRYSQKEKSVYSPAHHGQFLRNHYGSEILRALLLHLDSFSNKTEVKLNRKYRGGDKRFTVIYYKNGRYRSQKINKEYEKKYYDEVLNILGLNESDWRPKAGFIK